MHQFQIIRRSLNDLRDLADQFDEMNRNTLRIEDFDLPNQDDFKGKASMKLVFSLERILCDGN